MAKVTRLKRYIVEIAQFHEPIIVMAENEEEAKKKAVEDNVWEPVSIAVQCEEFEVGKGH